MIGKIQRVPLREVFPHEANGFTTWLANNIDVVNEALGISLTDVEREQDAGAFRVDLVAQDNAGNRIIVENQLEKSNHDHLGKIITYLTSLDAQAAIWIVSDPRPEHVQAIAWLNEGSPAEFYLVKVEAIRIGDSPPAPLFTLITGPSEEAREAGAAKKELVRREVMREKFWTGLLEYAKEKTDLHAAISPGRYNWIGTSAGLPYGINLNYAIRQHDGQVELYIDSDRDTGEGNTEVFNGLLKHKDELERDFGEPLEWEPLEGRRACRIRKTLVLGGWEDEEKWPQVYEEMVDAMIRLNEALRPHLEGL